MNANDFQSNVPSVDQQDLMSDMAIYYQDIADTIIGRVGPSAHRTAALRLLLESKMTLIHGITHPTSSKITYEPYNRNTSHRSLL
jgi:hypothetical protein